LRGERDIDHAVEDVNIALGSQDCSHRVLTEALETTGHPAFGEYRELHGQPPQRIMDAKPAQKPQERAYDMYLTSTQRGGAPVLMGCKAAGALSSAAARRSMHLLLDEVAARLTSIRATPAARSHARK